MKKYCVYIELTVSFNFSALISNGGTLIMVNTNDDYTVFA